MQEVVIITKAGYLSEKAEHNRSSAPSYSDKDVDHVSPGTSFFYIDIPLSTPG
jgi:hypothetical protein